MRFFSTVLLLVFLRLKIGLCQTQTACDSSGRLCFQEFSDPSSDVTVGFALPFATPGSGGMPFDIIGKVSFPLPYGFAGTTLGETMGTGRHTRQETGLRTAMPLFSPIILAARGLTPSQFVAQFSSILPNNTLAPFGDVSTQISPKSSIDSNRAELIFLCRECVSDGVVPPIFTTRSVKLTLFVSDADPQYLGTNTSLAMLDLEGSEQTIFTLDVDSARTANFQEMQQMLDFD